MRVLLRMRASSTCDTVKADPVYASGDSVEEEKWEWKRQQAAPQLEKEKLSMPESPLRFFFL